MVRLLKIVGMKKTMRNASLRTRLLIDLSRVSAMLKMYPLAMKYYEKAIRISQKSFQFTVGGNDSLLVLDSLVYQQLVRMDTSCNAPGCIPVDSSPVQAITIQQSFADGKKGISYAVLVHVKQPKPGKRKAFTGINNVGHTFITLIKYNEDQTFVSRSFGYYPSKKNFLSATPVHPSDEPVIKDDAQHDWDEVAGKFISEDKFMAILEDLQKFDKKRYNLNRNNCTDFGLSAAGFAGIIVGDTYGFWPFGSGNNPANAGQSILENKITNTDSENPMTRIVFQDMAVTND